MNKHVQNIFNSIVTNFMTGEIAESVAMACFPSPQAPSSSWSFTNRTIMFLSGTGDARGYQQWKAADRYVKKGSHPIHILAPCFKKDVDEKTGKEKRVLNHFNAVSVFRYEDTGGEELGLKAFEVPMLQLKTKCKEWGIPLQTDISFYRFYNYYSANRKEHSAATPDEMKFFWGLAKAGQKHLLNGNTPGPFHEAIADLCAQAICSAVGKTTVGDFKGAFQQIDLCAKEANKSVRYSCLYVLSEAERILNLIFDRKASCPN
tara:strand:- start:301 stop:1083 length:783 start_codon:yes stop_codon:yes gene_type:complete